MRIFSVTVCGVIVVLAAGCSDDSANPGCTHECPESGVFGCAIPPDNGLVVCADFDDDPCLEWGGFFECQNGATCSNGECTGGCVNECATSGALLCDGDGYRECGQHDADSCLEWGSVIPCPNQQTCSNGICSGTCTHECDDGERECAGNGYRACGQYDSDSCRDWSPIEPCGQDETCDGGQCVSTQCTEEWEPCVCGDNECCEGHCCPFEFVCVPYPPDEDHCF